MYVFVIFLEKKKIVFVIFTKQKLSINFLPFSHWLAQFYDASTKRPITKRTKLGTTHHKMTQIQKDQKYHTTQAQNDPSRNEPRHDPNFPKILYNEFNSHHI
jgi:hypothetical protein